MKAALAFQISTFVFLLTSMIININHSNYIFYLNGLTTGLLIGAITITAVKIMNKKTQQKPIDI